MLLDRGREITACDSKPLSDCRLIYFQFPTVHAGKGLSGPMLPIILATYGTVFVAEIVGDKLLYTTGVLATRYKTAPIMCGMALAFMLKMGVAVYVSKFISHLPPWLVALITAINFIAIAIVLWRKPDKREIKQYPASRAVGVSFAAIFFSEWGDVGQLTAAGMALKFPNALLLVWIGAVAAMVTKGILAASIGAGVRGWIQSHLSPKVIRYAAVGLLLFLGLLSVIETLTDQRTPGMLLGLMR
jgi:putative Ca2+/H+ antiporter (TMEM165/GDT1 family)